MAATTTTPRLKTRYQDELRGKLQTELGLESGATSQHLAALRRVGLVESRREGTSVFYRAADEKVFDLLAAGRALVARQLEDQQSMLRELAET